MDIFNRIFKSFGLIFEGKNIVFRQSFFTFCDVVAYFLK